MQSMAFIMLNIYLNSLKLLIDIVIKIKNPKYFYTILIEAAIAQSV